MPKSYNTKVKNAHIFYSFSPSDACSSTSLLLEEDYRTPLGLEGSLHCPDAIKTGPDNDH